LSTYILNIHLQLALFGKTFKRKILEPLWLIPELYSLKLSNVKSTLLDVEQINSLLGIPWQFAEGGGPHCANSPRDIKANTTKENIRIRVNFTATILFFIKNSL
jgi:hypothetical protein